MDDNSQLYTLSRNEIEQIFNYLNAEQSKKQQFRKNVYDKIITMVFSFLIALFWKDAIRSGIDKLLEKAGVPSANYFYEFIIAIVLTFGCIQSIEYFLRQNRKTEQSRFY